MRVIVPRKEMYIHVIGLAYIAYALNLMWVVGQLIHPRLRVVNPLTIVVALVVGTEFIDFLLTHNPLVGFRHYVLLLVNGLAILSACTLLYDEHNEYDSRRLKTTVLIGVAGLAMGIAIAVFQDQKNPLTQLFHW